MSWLNSILGKFLFRSARALRPVIKQTISEVVGEEIGTKEMQIKDLQERLREEQAVGDRLREEIISLSTREQG